MNHSLYSADRMTHLKIVVVALIGATLVAGVGVTARVSSSDSAAQMDARGPAIKVGAPLTVTSSETRMIR